MTRFHAALRLALPCCLAGCSVFPQAAKGVPAQTESFQDFRVRQTHHTDVPEPPRTPEAILESQVQLAGYHIARKEFPQADLYLKKALAQAPTHVPALVSLAKYHQARGDDAKAREALRQALAADPGAPLAWNEVATLRAAEGDYHGAVEGLSKALERRPNHPLYLENLGSVYALAGDYEAAYQAYVRALGPAESRYRIAGTLYARGDLAGARRQLSAGAAETPNHAPTLRMLKELDEAEAGAGR